MGAGAPRVAPGIRQVPAPHIRPEERTTRRRRSEGRGQETRPARAHLRIGHAYHDAKDQIPVLAVGLAITPCAAGLTMEPSPHGAHGRKTPAGTPAGGQQAAFRLQPDGFVAVLGATLLGPEFAGALRDILVGQGGRSVALGGGVRVLRVAVVVFHGESEVE